MARSRVASTDDELGHLYISEEDEAIWKYGAEPTAPTDPDSRVAVDRPIAAGGHFRPDAEGLTLVYLPDGGGYLIASSQAGSNTLNSFLVYDRLGSNPFIREFRVVDGPSVDGCGWTDGIDALGRGSRSGPSQRGVHLSGQQQHVCRGAAVTRTSSSSRLSGLSVFPEEDRRPTQARSRWSWPIRAR